MEKKNKHSGNGQLAENPEPRSLAERYADLILKDRQGLVRTPAEVNQHLQELGGIWVQASSEGKLGEVREAAAAIHRLFIK